MLDCFYYSTASQVSCASSSSELTNRTQFINHFGILATEADLAFGFYSIIRHFKWKRVTILLQEENLFTAVSLPDEWFNQCTQYWFVCGVFNCSLPSKHLCTWTQTLTRKTASDSECTDAVTPTTRIWVYTWVDTWYIVWNR